MNKYPKFLKVANKKYKINTDFRVALECDKIARDINIGEYEKILAIIYLLLGDEALEDYENHDKLFRMCEKYLRCNKEVEELNDEATPSMDFEQDAGYIKTSFMTDYQIDLDKIELHWWAFIDLMTGFTEDTVLNRVRYIREEPLHDKKGKELEKWEKLKKSVALKYEKTEEEKWMDDLFDSQMRGE